jgi:predicted nicotinamide N-methyase
MAVEARNDSRMGGSGGEPLWAARARQSGLADGRQLDTLISLIAALLLGSLLVFTQL